MTFSRILSVIGELLWLSVILFWLTVCGALIDAFFPSSQLNLEFTKLPLTLYITALVCIALLGWYKMAHRSQVVKLVAVSALGLTLLSFFIALLIMGEPEYISLYKGEDMIWLGPVGLVLWTLGNFLITVANGFLLITMIFKPFLLVILPLLILPVGWSCRKIYRSDVRC